MSRDPFHQPRVLRAPSNLALNPAREGAATASLGSLGQCFTPLTGKNFFLISDLNLPSITYENTEELLDTTRRKARAEKSCFHPQKSEKEAWRDKATRA